MPKASGLPSKAVETQMGIQEGNVEILNAGCKIHQFPASKKTGEQSAPFTCVFLQLQKLDADLEPTEDTPETVYYPLGKDSVSKFHPGTIDGPDDEDPTDEGDDVGTEGNTIYTVSDDAKLNKKCKFIILSESLIKQGVKPEIIDSCFLPALIGIKGHVKTHKMDKIEGSEKEPTVLIFDKIMTFPGKKGKKAAEPPAKDNKKVSKKPTDDDENDSDEAGVDDARAIIVKCAKKLKGSTVTLKKLVQMATTEGIQMKLKSDAQKAVIAKVKSLTWLATEAADEDSSLHELFTVDGGDETLEFAD